MFYHPDVSPNPTPNLRFTKNKLFCDRRTEQHRQNTNVNERGAPRLKNRNKKYWGGDIAIKNDGSAGLP